MEKVINRAGVSGLVVGVGIVVVLYSLWGASLLHQNQTGLRQAGSALSGNL